MIQNILSFVGWNQEDGEDKSISPMLAPTAPPHISKFYGKTAIVWLHSPSEQIYFVYYVASISKQGGFLERKLLQWKASLSCTVSFSWNIFYTIYCNFVLPKSYYSCHCSKCKMCFPFLHPRDGSRLRSKSCALLVMLRMLIPFLSVHIKKTMSYLLWRPR